jgi:A/G-specific adenine glycosylase
MTSAKVISRILSWGSANRSDFPWRETRDPFKVLIAELLLRKTTRHQVAKVFTGFIRAYGSVQQLSKAKPAEIRKVISSLGLERIRSTILLRAANHLILNHKGRVPRSQQNLLDIPGVGRYTTNAVRCFAFGYDEPLVDTNVARVVQRLHSVETKRRRPTEDEAVWSLVSSMIPPGKGREFNFAMLDLGGIICLARNPKCEICPVNDACAYYSTHRND